MGFCRNLLHLNMLIIIKFFLGVTLLCTGVESVEDPSNNMRNNDKEVPLDPVAQMKKLLDQEIRESQENREQLKAQGVNIEDWYREGLRAHGVNVEEWEKKLGFTLTQVEEGNVPDSAFRKAYDDHGKQHGEL